VSFPIDRRVIVSRPNILTREAGEGEGETPPRRTITGYAAVFNEWTTLWSYRGGEVREVIRPGAFRIALETSQDVRALENHDSSRLLGRTKAGTLRLREDDKGLWFEVDPPNTRTADDLIENLRAGNIDQCSFAFQARKDGGQRIIRREEGERSITEIELLSVDLYDVSIVTYPAYEGTSASVGLRDRLSAEKTAYLNIVDSKIASFLENLEK